MTLTVLFVTLAVLLVMTVPVALSIFLACVAATFVGSGMSLDAATRSLVTSLDSFPLLAVPFFILAGDLMGSSGISKRLFNLANSLVGSRTGGFGIAAVITCVFFAAISGSGPATVAAVGGIMIPEMVRRGYDRAFATAIVASAGAIGVIIPPSIPLVMYGVVAGQSVGTLFLKGIVPGIFIALVLSAVTYFTARKRGYHGVGKFSFREVLRATWDAKWALMIPVIVLGGIYGGFFTPTESAAVAIVVGVLVGYFAYDGMDLKALISTIGRSAGSAASIMFIVAAATVLSRIITIEQLPANLAAAIGSFTASTLIFLLSINIILLIMGTFIDAVSAIIIVTPIFLPIAVVFNVDPIHFGLIMVINLSIGFITPPLGVNLFVGSMVGGVSVAAVVRKIVPFLLATIASLMIVTYVPGILLI